MQKNLGFSSIYLLTFDPTLPNYYTGSQDGLKLKRIIYLESLLLLGVQYYKVMACCVNEKEPLPKVLYFIPNH